MTGTELINAVADELTRSELSATGTKATVSQRALNRTIQDFVGRYQFSWRISASPQTLPTVVSQTDYTFSTVKPDLVHALILDTGDMSSDELGQLSPEEFLSRYPNLAYMGASIPCEYAWFGQNTARLAPPPDKVYNLRLYLCAEFTEITDFNAQMTQFPSRALEVVEIGLLMRLHRYLRDWDAFMSMRRDYEGMIKLEIQKDKDNPSLTFVKRGRKLVGPTGNYWLNPLSDGDR
jgi:hypothetical protein